MAALYAFSPSTITFRGFAAFKVKHTQLRLKWQRTREQREEVFRIARELGGYTDRELADLGLSRSEIPAVAQGTYRRE
jgi:uncharacterized protein YjiS (DUF1127 family)